MMIVVRQLIRTTAEQDPTRCCLLLWRSGAKTARGDFLSMRCRMEHKQAIREIGDPRRVDSVRCRTLHGENRSQPGGHRLGTLACHQRDGQPLGTCQSVVTLCCGRLGGRRWWTYFQLIAPNQIQVFVEVNALQKLVCGRSGCSVLHIQTFRREGPLGRPLGPFNLQLIA